MSYYNIIDHIPYAVLYVTLIHLFYNWKFDTLNAHLPTPSDNH